MNYTNNMKTTFIYTLSYPEGNIRYVGKSDEPQQRLKNHIYEARRNKWKSYKNNWIRELLTRDNRPIMQIIEEVDIDQWQKKEIYYINHYRSLGFDLVNTAPGGQGGGVEYHSEESKRKISDALKGKYSGEKNWNFGKKMGPSSRREKTYEEIYGEEKAELIIKQISESHKGKIHPEEQNYKHSLFMLGKQYNLGKKDSEETKIKKSKSAKESQNEGKFKLGTTPWNKGVCLSDEEKKKRRSEYGRKYYLKKKIAYIIKKK